MANRLQCIHITRLCFKNFIIKNKCRLIHCDFRLVSYIWSFEHLYSPTKLIWINHQYQSSSPFLKVHSESTQTMFFFPYKSLYCLYKPKLSMTKAGCSRNNKTDSREPKASTARPSKSTREKSNPLTIEIPISIEAETSLTNIKKKASSSQ